MASNELRRRLEVALGSGAARDELESVLSEKPFGPTIYVDSAHGSDTQHDGGSAETPLATFAQAMTNIGRLNSKYKNDGIIRARGYFTEHVTAPLGAYGWTIVNGAGGRPRHGTADGVFLDSNGCHWAADAGDAPLLELREHGWAVVGLMMVPQSGYGAVQLHRLETAATPDASHAVIARNRFFGPSALAGYGIDDVGMASHVSVIDNEFEGLEYGYYGHGGGIDAGNRDYFTGNHFTLCKNDIYGNFFNTTIERNFFHTPWHTTDHLFSVNLAATQDVGVATKKNMVIDNTFADVANDIDAVAKGYKGGTGDIWRNLATDQAAFNVTTPS